MVGLCIDDNNQKIRLLQKTMEYNRYQNQKNQRDSFNLLGREANVIATVRGAGSSEAWYLYNKDVRGSTSSLIDDGGTAAAAYTYDEFGNTTIRAGEGFENAFLSSALAVPTKRTAQQTKSAEERAERTLRFAIPDRCMTKRRDCTTTMPDFMIQKTEDF